MLFTVLFSSSDSRVTAAEEFEVKIIYKDRLFYLMF